jgi:hypothetical protein
MPVRKLAPTSAQIGSWLPPSSMFDAYPLTTKLKGV